jgi:hypothetical protein
LIIHLPKLNGAIPDIQERRKGVLILYNKVMTITSQNKLIPVYTSHGEVGAFILFPFLYNPNGEWIGWLTADRNVFSVYGHYVGFLTNDPRILRKRESAEIHARQTPPAAAPPIRVPAQLPLAPQLPEVALNMIDVLEEAPELLPSTDHGALKEDID